ncbi:MAG: transferase 2, rSAM/selenodomain-associated [Acidobacteria bacterium]|nr:transferase 2, rSAM/selenodomain-associated [Acidobacteriota bacterium]
MPGLSVVIIAKNEAAHIEAALESVAWADETIVVDAESTDDTVARARRFTSRVVVRPWEGYGAQKNHGASIATHDWILSIDADERVSPALALEIRRVLTEGADSRGYRMPRVAWFLGRWFRTTDWYPDYQLRLYDRRAGRWSGREVHESVQLEGPVGYLKAELQHYPFRDLSHYLEKIDRYSTLAARQLDREGHVPRGIDVLVYPPAAFIRNYLLRGGIRDGVPGFVVSVLGAYYVFLKFAKLWESRHVLAARRHGAELAGRTEPGTAHGDGAPGSGAPGGTGRAS